MTSRTDRIAGILSRLGEKLNKIYEEAAALPDREVVGFAEQRVLAAVQEVGQELQQDMVKEQIERRDPTEHWCECGTRMEIKDRRKKAVCLRNGEVILKRRYFICPRCKAKATPLDRVLGLEGRYSQMVDELMGLVDVLGSSRKAEEMLWRLSGLRISYRVIHQKAVELGEELEELQQSSLPGGRLPADTSRAYTSADGVMVNTKTGYHEMKLACLWSEGNDYRRYTATMEPCDKFGQKVRRMVCLAGGHTIDELVAIADGAAWIWEQVRTRLPFVSTQIVDFYHAAEQIATAARALHGEGTQAAKNWLRDARHVLRHEGGRALLKKLKKSRHYRRGNEAIHALVGYISKHVQRMDYPRLKSAGLTIGSGLIESGCKNVVQMRLKGPGMRWRPEAASAVANLRGLFLSDHWDSFFRLRRAG